MVNGSQVRTFIILNDKTCEIQSRVRACTNKNYFHNDISNVSKFDRVIDRITTRAKSKERKITI